MKRWLHIAVVAVLVVAGVFLVRGLSRLAQQPDRLEETGGVPAGAPVRTVRLFFGAPGRVDFLEEERVIVTPPNPESLAEAVAREAIAGPIRGVGGLPHGMEVRGFYLTPDGIGYLDLSRDLIARYPAGDGLEWVSLGSLVRSICDNVPRVRAVQILVDGKIVERSPGSIPLDLPLAPEAFGSAAGAGDAS